MVPRQRTLAGLSVLARIGAAGVIEGMHFVVVLLLIAVVAPAIFISLVLLGITVLTMTLNRVFRR